MNRCDSLDRIFFTAHWILALCGAVCLVPLVHAADVTLHSRSSNP